MAGQIRTDLKDATALRSEGKFLYSLFGILVWPTDSEQLDMMTIAVIFDTLLLALLL